MSILKRTKKTEEAVKPEKKARAPKASKRESVAKKSDAKPAKKLVTGDAYKVIVKPMITERAAGLASENVYVFMVFPGAGKVEIKNAIKSLYGVMPERVNIVNVLGKRKRFGRIEGRRSDWKKAFVYLKKGQHIDVYEGV
jgi:large subunit ribosomal protein L23